jgi:hypothetical protein
MKHAYISIFSLLTFHLIGDNRQYNDEEYINHLSTMTYKTKEMNVTNISQFEDLPVEMLIEIFRYLSIHELCFAFSQLNLRLNSILKSMRSLILVTSSHCDPVLSFFDSFAAVQIHFHASTSSPLAQFNVSNFTGIQSFVICRSIYSDAYLEPIEQLDKFICPTLCPQLQSLRIPYCSQTLADWIFTGAFPHLKICHLYDVSYEKMILPSSTVNTMASLRQLAIEERNGDEFEKILLMCPHLSYLNFSCDCALSSFVHGNASYLSLKRLRLSRLKQFLFHNGQFDSLLSIFPNLIHFDLTVDQCHEHDETIDFTRIAQYLRQHLPRLALLEWRIYITVRNRSSFYRHTFNQISQLHPLFKCFGRIAGLLHIACFDFTSIYHYDRQFVRSSVE